jgi:flagellar basal body rod protein FlgG
LKARRSIAATLATIGALVAATAVASAAENIRISGSFSFVDQDTCVNPIRVDGSYDETMHTYLDRSGNPVRLAFTGPVSISYTNTVTGALYAPNSSGPSTVNLQTGQDVLRGGNGALFDSNGVLISTDGRVVLDANGDPISLPGHIIDVCTRVGSAPA